MPPPISPGNSPDSSAISSIVKNEPWYYSPLTITIIGASGDLAKKKTYPSLLSLYLTGLLPPHFRVFGYARSPSSDEAFRAKIRPFLVKSSKSASPSLVDSFLASCFYLSGPSYGDEPAFSRLHAEHLAFESSAVTAVPARHAGENPHRAQLSRPSVNRLWYFAVPSTVFALAASRIRELCMRRPGAAEGGWTRIIVEKPFGRDSGSCEALTEALAGSFSVSRTQRFPPPARKKSEGAGSPSRTSAL
ncbi:hypothetical protein TeGR_g587 [Tetraparma gracilis]|uniref:glucose-6-phosphate dehydrogenase (NADP(+)) n=1 Tax=Tetraparma gracilis TaxID=2962635 RepID=A0ABQ6MUT3_9STRA|nr:hypothetical protein TeGR_g587 [Tetraparma gracilis]